MADFFLSVLYIIIMFFGYGRVVAMGPPSNWKGWAVALCWIALSAVGLTLLVNHETSQRLDKECVVTYEDIQ